MSIAVDHLAVLLLLPLALLPFFATMLAASGHPSLAAVPRDGLSVFADATLRVAAAVAIMAIVLGLAGIHRRQQMIERQGRGAHIVLLIDRSASMDNSFADRSPTGEDESKSAAARRLLADFVARRPHDRIGIAAFSSSPMPVVALTDHHAVVQAAVDVIDRPGLASTDVGRGLMLAMTMVEEGTPDAPRAVVLVSDGAAVIDRRVQAALQDAATRAPVNLYWLFLRTRGSRSIFEPPATGELDTPQANPERHLHQFLSRLGLPYHAFEATSPAAVQQAIAEIDRQEARPLRYFERAPRRDLAGPAYVAALIGVMLLLAAKLAERGLAAERAALRPKRRVTIREVA
jgi:mxaC protein